MVQGSVVCGTEKRKALEELVANNGGRDRAGECTSVSLHAATLSKIKCDRPKIGTQKRVVSDKGEQDFILVFNYPGIQNDEAGAEQWPDIYDTLLVKAHIPLEQPQVGQREIPEAHTLQKRQRDLVADFEFLNAI